VNVGPTYTDPAIMGRDESKFALMFFDGQQPGPRTERRDL